MLVLVSERKLQAGVARLAAEIDRDYVDSSLVLVCVLKGAALFAADLLRRLRSDVLRVEYIRASSYGSGTESSGTVTIEGTLLPETISGRNILLVDDITDTGHTLVAVAEHIRRMKPATLKVCTLLDKPERREAAMEYDYVGFSIPNYFVVGYGMDLDERYRGLPAVYYFPDG
jgi:hypoxanthine phosphoribosyltransferase